MILRSKSTSYLSIDISSWRRCNTHASSLPIAGRKQIIHMFRFNLITVHTVGFRPIFHKLAGAKDIDTLRLNDNYFSSCNGLLPRSTKPLSKQRLNNHQWGLVAFARSNVDELGVVVVVFVVVVVCMCVCVLCVCSDDDDIYDDNNDNDKRHDNNDERNFHNRRDMVQSTILCRGVKDHDLHPELVSGFGLTV